MFGNFAAEKAFSAVRTTLFTAAFCAALTLQLHAADRPQWTGTFQHLSGFTMHPPHSYHPAVQRLSLELDQRLPDGRFHTSANIRNYFTASPDSLDIYIPELWIEFWLSRGDLLVGRQDLRRGLTPANSLFEFLRPRDLRNFVIEPDNATVRGNIALSYRHYTGNSVFELVFSPVITPVRLPHPEDRWFIPVPTPAGLPLRISDFPSGDNRPDRQLTELQTGLIWEYDLSASLEIQLSAFHWVPPMPSYQKKLSIDPADPFASPAITLKPSFKPTLILGGGTSYRAGSGITLTAEALWFQDEQFDRVPGIILEFDPASTSLGELARITRLIDEEEDGFLSAEQSYRLLTEIRYERSTLLAGVQWFMEGIRSPHPDIVRKERFHRFSGFVARDLFRERLSNRMQTTYHPAGNDFWISSEHIYDISDQVNLGLGTHIFGGSDPGPGYGHLSFGSYRTNSLVYGTLKFYW